MKIDNILNYLEEIAPKVLADNWDNPGWQLKPIRTDIEKVLLTVDVNKSIVDEAVKGRFDLIISHHPLFFGTVRTIDFTSEQSAIIKLALDHDIGVWSAHTNLDSVSQGTSFSIASSLGLNEIKFVRENKTLLASDKPVVSGKGALGRLNPPLATAELISRVRSTLEVNHVRVTHFLPKVMHSLVAVGAGSGSYLIQDCINNGASVLITSDVKYHNAITAFENGLTIIDVDHYYAERLVLPPLAKGIKENLNLDVEISRIPTTAFSNLKDITDV